MPTRHDKLAKSTQAMKAQIDGLMQARQGRPLTDPERSRDTAKIEQLIGQLEQSAEALQRADRDQAAQEKDQLHDVDKRLTPSHGRKQTR